MAGALSNLLKVILPKRRANDRGTAFTNTFDPTQTGNPLPAPTYREHTQDLFTQRSALDNRALLSELFKHDPDISAAVSAYLTVADTEPCFFVRDLEGNIDREGHKLLEQILMGLTQRTDYSKGFLWKKSLNTLAEEMRYMLLLRGGIGAELVLEKTLLPKEIRLVDLATIEWYETEPGKFVPVQSPAAADTEISLDIPTFYATWHRRDPNSIYSYSPFVSAINTVAARQQVINDLYRVMQLTGFPRIQLKVIEEVLQKNAPADVKADAVKLRDWTRQQLQAVANSFAQVRADQPYVHTDSVEVSIMNDRKASVELNITSVIETLNAQNQAALKTMATIIGRGTSGVNTASVEARIFSMSSEELNDPIAEIWGHLFTMALRLHGSESFVEVKFKPVELRPELELEPQKIIKQNRLLELLSLGLITDDDFHIEMFGRIRPDNIPELSGTGFMQPGSTNVDTDSISPNSDPLGRSIAPSGSEAAKSNSVKGGRSN